MHFLEQYALTCGAKIDRAFIAEEFFPLPFEKYICINMGSGMDSKNYDHYDEVLDLLLPMLRRNDIHIVQIGASDERVLKNCFCALSCSKRQTAHIISNSILYFGSDTFSLHLASHYGKKIVCASTITYPQCFYPYWSKKEDVKIIESHRDGNKPSFTAAENPKTINYIKPEEIAIEVFKFLNIDYKLEFKSVYFGKLYRFSDLIYESAMDQVFNLQKMNLDKILCRMDFNFNPPCLEAQLADSKCAIVTDGPIDEKLMAAYKHNVIELMYIIKGEGDPSFAKAMHKLGIKLTLISEEEQEKTDLRKIDYMDLGLVHSVRPHNPLGKEIKKEQIKNLYYKSNKFTLSEGKIYPSKYAWEKNLSIMSKSQSSKVPEDNEEFWRESNNFYFLEKA
jgi:hypothetical protein